LIAARGVLICKPRKDGDAAHAAGAIGARMDREHGRQREERVGPLSMRVEAAEPSERTREAWARRSEALTAWLLDEWEREREEAA